MMLYITLQYVAKVLIIDKRTTVSEVKKMLEPFVKRLSNQFMVCDYKAHEKLCDEKKHERQK